jgi:TRAP-type C4-dicarboxylate transport system permease small subunit
MVFSQISIFLSASLMFFYFLAELIDRLRQAAGKNPIFLQEDESQ